MRILSRYTIATWTLVAAAIILAGAIGRTQQAPPAAPQTPAAPAQGGPPFPRVQPLQMPTTAQTFETLQASVRVVPFVGGLVQPWSMAFLPNGDMLVTEKAGQLRIVRGGKLDPKPIAGVPAVFSTGQGGLLEVALHPQYAENRYIYLTYSKPGERGATTALARGRFDGNTLTEMRDIFVAENWATGGAHFGSRLAFGRDGMLYMTIGERNDRNRAQDLNIHGGKIMRLKDDGTTPPDNPFVGRAGVLPQIFSYGHRNMQGLTFHPETGVLWEIEHGPQGGDELNIIVGGRNYGWPIVTFGREYSGEPIANQPWREGMEQPVIFWVPSIALSGMAFYTGDRFPAWKGNLFVGALAGLQLQRVAFTDKGPVGRESLLGSLRLRIRDVRQGPDGFLYLAVDDKAGGILRLEPGQAGTSTAGRQN